MPAQQVAQQLTTQGEQPTQTQVMRQFGGCYTKSQRSAVPQDRFYDLENVIPLGAANCHVVNNISAQLYDFVAGTNDIYASQFGAVASAPYLFNSSAQGNIIAWNINAATATQINGLHTYSSSGVRSVSWFNTYQLFIDSTGYGSWPGAGNITPLALAHGPTQGTDIAVAFGRVWVSNGRLILFSAAYDGTSTTDPTNDTAWQAANGAGFVNMTDPALVGNIVRLWAQNGFLYIFGSTCVFAISNLYVPFGAVPPTPVFTITPIQSIIGTNQPFAIFPYNRALMFANSYGAWAIEGVEATRISEDLDGTWQFLAPTANISGGQCIVQSILNAAFLIQRQNDPVFGSNTVVALWFDGKWWFANFGAITFLMSGVVGSQPVLFALIGNQLFELFQDATTAPATTIMSPLWDMDDPLSDKECIRAGFEIFTTLTQSTNSITSTIDTEAGSQPLNVTATLGTLNFVNGSGQPITFVGAGPITWVVGGHQLYSSVAPGGFGKFIGMTIKTTGVAYEFDSFLMDLKTKRKRW